MAVTLHDVARVAGVSIKTVSNVINDYPHIRVSTRERVLSAIDELGYQPNLSARGLRSGRTGAIGLIIPDLKNAYFAELADAVIRSAAEHGLAVVIQQSEGDREREIQLLSGPQMRMVDGVLLSVLGLGAEDAEFLRISKPLVLLGERAFDGAADQVTMQNVAAARAATELLIKWKRRRILALGASMDQAIGSTGLRLEGYRQALETAGIPIEQELIVAVDNWRRSEGAEAMRAALARNIRFDGVIAFNDVIALGAMRALQETGVRIPEDVALIGFDDIDETRYSLPTLSTIDPGRSEIATEAVRMLLERISGNKDLPPRLYEASFRVVERESTAAKAP